MRENERTVQRMPPKPNAMLARMEARLKAQYDAAFNAKISMVMQLGQDAAMIAANEVLQMGKGRAEAFCRAYMKAANEMSHLMHDDQKDDPDFEYAKAKIDQRIRAIIGDEIFVPWEMRYGQVEYKEKQ